MPFDINFSASVFNPGTGTVEIAVTRPTNLVAPAMVKLEAVNYSGLKAAERSGTDYDHTAHEYFHVWTINGQPLSAFTAPVNMPTEWNNPNKMYGKRARFVLPTAGDYTINLWVVDRDGVTATASIAFSGADTIQDPDTFFAGKTHVVAADGDFTGAPAGSQYTSIASALAALSNSTNDHRILLKRGEVYDEDVRRRNSGPRWCYLGDWGSGAKPRVRRVDVDGSINYDCTTVQNIQTIGSYDATIERDEGNMRNDNNGSIGFGGNLFANTAYSFNHDFLIVVGCDVRKGNNCLSVNNLYANEGRVIDADTVFWNCAVDEWRNFGSFCQSNIGGGIAYIGCRFVQNPDALSGGPKDGFGNVHGPIRLNAVTQLTVTACDLFSCTGWANGLSDQPCLRGSAYPRQGDVAQVDRNVMEGGLEVCRWIRNAGETTGRWPGNIVVENNLFIGTTMTSSFLSTWRSGFTARNNYFWLPDVQAYPIGGATGVYLSASYDSIDYGLPSGGTDAGEPLAFYNNTALNQQPAAKSVGGGRTWAMVNNSDSYYSDLSDENNIRHQPSAQNPVDLSPVSLAGLFSNVTTRHKGTRVGFRPASDVLTIAAGGIANGASLSEIPYSAFTQELRDLTTLGDNTTDQAYWQAREAAGSTNHAISIGGTLFQNVNEGQIGVTFTTTGVVIQNTSGTTWPAGAVSVDLDRRDVIPPRQTQYASDGLSVPLLRPASGSSAYQSATGTTPPKDLLLADRTAPKSQGALVGA